jgi:hypothetical protein
MIQSVRSLYKKSLVLKTISTQMLSHLLDICFSAMSIVPLEFSEGHPLHHISLTHLYVS